MTITTTSAAVYRQIKQGGLLSKMRWRVFEQLYSIEDMRRVVNKPPGVTAAEVAATFPPSRGGRGMAGNVHARLGELVDWGAVQKLSPRLCQITGREVTTYATSGKLPRRPPSAPKKAALTPRLRRVLKEIYRTADSGGRASITDIIVLLEEYDAR